MGEKKLHAVEEISLVFALLICSGMFEEARAPITVGARIAEEEVSVEVEVVVGFGGTYVDPRRGNGMPEIVVDNVSNFLITSATLLLLPPFGFGRMGRN